MKLLLLSGVLFLFAEIYAEDSWPVEGKILAECLKELGVPEGNTDDSKLRCVGSCVLKKTGLLESGKKINVDKLKENMPNFGKEQKEAFLKQILDCMAEAKSIEDECDYINAIVKCSNAKQLK